MKPKRRHIPQNRVLVALGWASVGLGIIGTLLPIMPTTPFLILAAYFFSKGSPRLHRWLRQHRHLGPALRDWEDHRIISLKARIAATIAIVISFSISSYMIWGRGYLGEMLIAIAALTLLFIWTRRLHK